MLLIYFIYLFYIDLFTRNKRNNTMNVHIERAIVVDPSTLISLLCEISARLRKFIIKF